ncbi:glycosyltransferase family 2 protein [Rhodococcus sp. B50]|uniref:glycosyltransferase family 2 protein n=1 Tax=Rhodococcus sp. B50 TaxID=2682847 RepID=UPI001BD4C5CC|nr:glycosyltransferase family 2 protein [Rhodococcus sp. B50]MBS9375450.1 putative glycosyltransferase [Rhodococcus sp. B50]
MEDQLPCISIVTVVRNNLQGLITTAESIQRQKYNKIEHVIVDGASTDGTLDWLAAYKPNYRVSFISEPDNGIYDAMNKGINLASGDVVQFLNGGDELASDSVLNIVAQSYHESRWDWAYGQIRYVNGKYERIREYSFSPFSLKKLSMGLAFTPHPATFVKRSGIETMGGFRSEFGFSADQEMAVRLGKQASPSIIDTVITNYLIEGAHGASKPADTARRYARIRRANGLLVGGSRVLDAGFTIALATFWTARAQAGRLRQYTNR